MDENDALFGVGLIFLLGFGDINMSSLCMHGVSIRCHQCSENRNLFDDHIRERVDNFAKLILKANRKQIREALTPDELEYFDKTYGI